MVILDVIIVLILLVSMFIGYKQGFLKGIISLIGISFIAIVSFIFRDNLADILLKICPFFKFSGSYEGITSLNILVYEGISFIAIFLLLFGALAFILGILPLVFAVGPGSKSRISLGVTVFGGMSAAAVVGTIMVPAFYVVIQMTREYTAKHGYKSLFKKLREKFTGKNPNGKTTQRRYNNNWDGK